MNVFEKIKRSWWVILSFILFINGFGFLYIGFKNNNRNWVLEGIIYEIPWLFYVIFAFKDNILDIFVVIAVIIMFISIIRSFWVAIKLADIYDNEEKYTIRPTVVKKQNTPKENNNSFSKGGCCICLLAIFFIFAIIAIL